MFRTIDALDVKGKRVLVRCDLNVPAKDGKVTDTTRIDRSVDTLKQLSAKGGKVIIMTHFGRPKGRDEKYSQKLLLEPLAKAVGQPVGWADDCIGPEAEKVIAAMKDGDIVLLQNVRFYPEEEKNDPAFARKLAANGDVYVNDAFSTAHRAHASTEGLAHILPAAAGRLMQAELEALGKALHEPARPLVAIVGGSKVSSKLTVLESLSHIVDQLIVGGGIANTFIKAAGYNVGKSLYEADLVDEAKRLMAAAKAKGGEIPVPVDVVVGKKFAANEPSVVKKVSEVEDDDMIFDIGPETSQIYAEYINKAGTIVWNGPVGVFEFDQFGEGTRSLGTAIAVSSAFSIAGGGDTLAAIAKYGICDRVSYISTGGGAFLEFLEGKKLPAVAMLEQRAQG